MDSQANVPNRPAEQPFVRPEVVRSPSAAGSPPPQIVIRQASGFRRFIAWTGWLGLLLCVPVILGLLAAFRDYYDNSGGIQEKYHSLAHYGRDKVAVINVGGVIMEGDGFVKRQIDRVRDDERVRAVVVRIDSPGGTITGSDFIYHHLKKLREERKIPLVVSMGGVAASGGYYVAMAVGDAEKSIFAEPTTTTGSIGVIIPHYDLSGLLERLDVKDDSIASHPRKQMLSMTRPLAPEDREILTRYINESFERFKEVVRSGRPNYREDKAALDDLATGEIFTATQAQQHGLVDEIGFVEDAIERAIQLAGLEKEKVRVVQYKQPLTLLSAMGWGSAPSADYSLTSLLELTVPRAYYLSTSLPPLLSTDRR